MAVVVAAMMPPPAMVVVVAKPHPNDKRVVPQGEVQAAVLATPAAKKDSRPVHQEDSSAKNDSRPVYQGDISTVVTGIRVVVTLAAAAARVVAAVARRRKKSGEQHASGLDIHAPPKTDGSLHAAAASGGQSGGVAPAASFARAETPTQVHAVRSAATKSQLASAPFQRTGGGGAPPKATPGTKKKTPLRAPTSKPTKPYELEDVVICGECCEECMTCEQPVVNTASIFTNRVTVILSPLQEDASEALGRRARVVSTVAMLDTGANESNFISRALANELVSLGGEICLSSDRVVCSAFIRQSLCKY